MRAFNYMLLLLLAYHQRSAAFSDKLGKCGSLNDTQLYSENLVTDLTEYPWFGRLLYTDTRTNTSNSFRCVAILITKRHLLAPAHCIHVNSYIALENVLLGDSDYGNPDTDPDCAEDGGCAPPPKLYEIDNVAVHPNFVARARLNDIAVIQLEEEVELSPYIEPICLPPSTDYTADYLAQYITYAGFVKTDPSGSQKKKIKIVAHVRERERCRLLSGSRVADTYICASSNGGFIFLSGAALIGVTIDNSQVQNYYLIGFLSFGAYEKDQLNIEFFTQVSAHINWIHSNIKISRNKK